MKPFSKRFFTTVFACLFITNGFAGVMSDAEINALNAKFTKESQDIRTFRAKGMLNYYFKLKKENSPDAQSYLQVIIKLFPEYLPARLEYVMTLEEKNHFNSAYRYLILFKDQKNSQVTTALNNLSIQVEKIEAMHQCPLTENNEKIFLENRCKIDKKMLALFSEQSTETVSDHKSNKPVSAADNYTNIMNQYYALKKADLKEACNFITTKTNQYQKHQTVFIKNGYCMKAENNKSTLKYSVTDNQQCENNFNLLLESGYCSLTLKKTSTALSYFLAAQKINPNKYEIANQIGYLESNLKQNKKAYQQFQLATKSENEETSDKAEVALINLSDYKFKFLPEPWYFEFYTEPYYYSRFQDYIFPMEARFGVALGENKQYYLYMSYRRSTDTASQFSGIAPQIYNDNVEVYAGGFRYFPIKNVPLFVYSEYGLAHDLQVQSTYPNTEQDYRGGVIYSNRWGAPAAYNKNFVTEFRPWSDFYGNVSYYSRYENMIGQLTGRLAASVFRWRHMTLSPYLKAQTFFDSQRLFYNNIVEYGPGIMFQPYNIINFAICYEHLFGDYIPVPNSTNPYGPRYQTNIIRMQLYVKF